MHLRIPDFHYVIRSRLGSIVVVSANYNLSLSLSLSLSLCLSLSLERVQFIMLSVAEREEIQLILAAIRS